MGKIDESIEDVVDNKLLDHAIADNTLVRVVIYTAVVFSIGMAVGYWVL